MVSFAQPTLRLNQQYQPLSGKKKARTFFGPVPPALLGHSLYRVSDLKVRTGNRGSYS